MKTSVNASLFLKILYKYIYTIYLIICTLFIAINKMQIIK